MKLSQYISLIVSLVTLTAATLAATGQGRPERPDMVAPLYDIEYIASSVHFDPAPASITSLCHEFKGRSLWLYAAYRTNDAEYYVVSGYIPETNKDDKYATELPGTGDIVALKGGHCAVRDTVWTFSGTIDPSKRNALPATFPEVLPGLDASPLCDNSGSCHYEIRSRQAEAILNGLADDAIARSAKAFGGKQRFLKRLHKLHPDYDELAPILRDRIKEYAKK